MNEIFQKGDKVAYASKGRSATGTIKNIHVTGALYITPDGGGSNLYKNPNAVTKVSDAVTDIVFSSPDIEQKSQLIINPPVSFSINERFKFMENLVKMIIKKTSVSLIITGEGGLGKTYTVMQQINNKQLQKNVDYVHIKGYSTARGLYMTLYENSDKIIVFDDCDEVLKDPTAKNILKGALDSSDERVIHWISSKIDDSVPSYFTFEGRIIFISNLPQERVDQALLSRSMSVDLTMSRKDKIERMRAILYNIKPSISLEIKEECLNLIEEKQDICRDLNMRTLNKVIEIRIDEENKDDWKNMAIYSMTNVN